MASGRYVALFQGKSHVVAEVATPAVGPAVVASRRSAPSQGGILSRPPGTEACPAAGPCRTPRIHCLRKEEELPLDTLARPCATALGSSLQRAHRDLALRWLERLMALVPQ